MDFALDARTAALHENLVRFLRDEVLPAEPLLAAQVAQSADPHAQPPALEHLKQVARSLGLWNLFLPHPTPWHETMTTLQYAPLAELSGRSQPWAPEAMNCSAPDTGNMELLALFGTTEQQEQWLRPLLDGQIRSAYVMTEPDVASSDASNVATRIVRDGDEYVVSGRKWWISGAARDRARLGILFGVSDPHADPHRRHSMVLFPLDAPGVRIVRELDVLGYSPWESHVELELDELRVPVTNLLGEEGGGFAMSQARLGPGRVHHCMRAIGAAERALELLVARVEDRVAFGAPLVEQGVVREWIAESRIEIDQARAYTLHTAWLSTPSAVAPRRVRSRASRSPCLGWPSGSSTGRCRLSALPACAAILRWRGCTPTPACSASPTAPTRCTCAPSRGPNSVTNARYGTAAASALRPRERACDDERARPSG